MPMTVSEGTAACVQAAEKDGGDKHAPGSPPLATKAACTPPMKTPVQLLNEFYTRHKGTKSVEWETKELPRGPSGPGVSWICKLILKGGSFGDRRLPEATYETEAPTKKAAEQEACQQAWDRLDKEGFITQKSLAPKTHISKATWEVPKRKSPTNPLAYADISIDNATVGRVVLEFFVDAVPQAAASFAGLFMPPAGGGSPPLKGASFVQVVQRGLLQLSSDLGMPGTPAASPNDEEEEPPRFALVHSRPFLLTYQPDAVQPWGLGITTARMSSLDGSHEVVGQVLKGFGVLRELASVPVGHLYQPTVPCCISDCGPLPLDVDLASIPCYKEDGLPMWPDDLDDTEEGQCEAECRLAMAAQMRTAGNEAYKAGQHEVAIRKYTQAIRYMDWASLRRQAELVYEHKKLMEEDSHKCLLNRAACYIQLEQHYKAAADCRKTLEYDQENPKALFRLGQALMGAKQLHEAVEVLHKAARLVPNDVSVRGALDKAKEEHRNRKLKEGSLYAKLFASGGLSDPADGAEHAQCAGRVEGDADLLGQDEDDEDEGEVVGLSPEVEEALEKFGNQPIPGYRHPVPHCSVSTHSALR